MRLVGMVRHREDTEISVAQDHTSRRQSRQHLLGQALFTHRLRPVDGALAGPHRQSTDYLVRH